MVLDFFEGYLQSIGTPTDSASRRLKEYYQACWRDSSKLGSAYSYSASMCGGNISTIVILYPFHKRSVMK